jgi:hypothetical protein
MKYLSMGMTNSHKIAIEEGANIVRIGTKIFGERDYGEKSLFHASLVKPKASLASKEEESNANLRLQVPGMRQGVGNISSQRQ